MSVEKIGIDRFIGHGQTGTMRYENIEDTRSGPFYIYTCYDVYRHEMRDGAAVLRAGLVTCISDAGRWEDARHVPHGIQQRVNGGLGFGFDPNGLVLVHDGKRETLDRLAAGAILQSIKSEYGYMGVTHLTAFDEMTPDAIGLDELNNLLYPKLCNYVISREAGVGSDFLIEIFDTDEEKQIAEQMGVLNYRKQLVKEAESRIKAEVEDPRRSIWLKAFLQIYTAFNVFENYANRHLDVIDSMLRAGNAGRKFYDLHDDILQRMLKRPRIDTAIERAIAGTDKLNAETVRSLVQETSAAAVKQTQASQVDVQSIIQAVVAGLAQSGVIPTPKPKPVRDQERDEQTGRFKTKSELVNEPVVSPDLTSLVSPVPSGVSISPPDPDDLDQGGQAGSETDEMNESPEQWMKHLTNGMKQEHENE